MKLSRLPARVGGMEVLTNEATKTEKGSRRKNNFYLGGVG